MDNYLSPNWSNSSVAICMASSDEYAKFLCTYLCSLKIHSDPNKLYDIIVFERDISDRNKTVITNAITSKNISVRFFNPTHILSHLQMYVTHSYFKEECYYRMCAPVVLKDYSRIIFTDIDIVLQDDILKLAEIDLGDQPIAACIEPLWHDIYEQDRIIEGYRIRDYASTVLNLPHPDEEYYNTGVVLYNVKKYNSLNSFEKLSELINANRFLYQEQCALNKLFNGQFVKLPPVWNYEAANYLSFFDKYKNYETEAKIIHFLGRAKPWRNPKAYLAEIWWRYARETPFYEEIILQLVLPVLISKANDQTNALISKAINQTNGYISAVNTQTNTNVYLTYVLSNLTLFKLKKNAYRMLKLLTWGKARQRFTQKHRRTKNLIKAAVALKRNLSKSVII